MKVIKKKLDGSIYIEIEPDETMITIHEDFRCEAFIPLPDNLETSVPTAFLALYEVSHLLKTNPDLVQALAEQFKQRKRNRLDNGKVNLLTNTREIEN